MANIKFSAFTTETDPTQIDFLAGYQGTTMKKIAPSNISGSYPFLIDTASLYSGFVPSGLSGSPQENTILGIDAGSSLTTGTSHTLIGNRAGENLTVEFGTTAVGFKAGLNQNAESFNTYIGYQSGRDHTGAQSVFVSGNNRIFNSGQTSNGVTAVGYSAHDTNAGNFSTAIGYTAGRSATGDSGTYVGRGAGNNNTAASHVSIGHDAGYSNTSGANNTNIGYQAGYDNTTNGSRTIIGYEAGEHNTGANNTFLGYHAGTGVAGSSTADRTTVIGSEAGEALTTGLVSTFIGYQAGKAMTVGTGNVAIGSEALKTEDSRSFSTACGSSALQDQNAAANAYNAAFGYQAGATITTGIKNTIVGGIAANDNSLLTGSNNIVIGYDSAPSADNVDNEITLGDANITALRIPGLQSGASDGDVLTFSSGTGVITLQAAGGGGGGATSLNGLSDVLIDGTSNYFVNIPAGLSGNPVDNLVIGDTAGDALTTGFSNVLLGHDAGLALTTGDGNINIGTEAGKTNATSDGQINIGFEAGSVCTNSGDVHIGYNAGKNSNPLIAGRSNVAIGKNALLGVAATTNSYASVAIGEDALKDLTTGDRIIGLGYQAGQGHTSNGDAIYIGYNAGGQLNASNTVIIGNGAVDSLVGAWNQHTVVGKDACAATSSGSGQVAFGYQALISQTSGNKNSAFGFECLESLTTSGDNAAFGYEAGDKVTGAQNTLFGSQAGSSGTNDLTSGDNNTLIGYNAEASAATVSNEITLGNSSIATLRCQVTSITALSDKRDKENIQPSTYGLDLINKLKPVTFDWNTRDGAKVGVKDLGFIAQDLQEVDNENLKLVYDNNPEKLEASYGRLVPVLVKAIQELKAEIELLKSK